MDNKKDKDSTTQPCDDDIKAHHDGSNWDMTRRGK